MFSALFKPTITVVVEGPMSAPSVRAKGGCRNYVVRFIARFAPFLSLGGASDPNVLFFFFNSSFYLENVTCGNFRLLCKIYFCF